MKSSFFVPSAAAGGDDPPPINWEDVGRRLREAVARRKAAGNASRVRPSPMRWFYLAREVAPPREPSRLRQWLRSPLKLFAWLM